MHHRARCSSVYIADVPVDRDGVPFRHGSGYWLWLFGVWYDETPDDGPGIAIYAAPFYPEGDPRRHTLPDAAPIGWIQAWLTRINPEGSPLYAQRKWGSGTDASCDIRGYQRRHTKRDRARAEHALELLTHIAELGPGRPPIPEEEARQAAALSEEGLTQPEIAKRLKLPLREDVYETPRRSDAAARRIKRGRELERRENP